MRKKWLKLFFVMILSTTFFVGCEKESEEIIEEAIEEIEIGRGITLDVRSYLTTESGFFEFEMNILLLEEGYLAYVVSENDRVKPIKQNIQFIWYGMDGSYQATETVLVEGLKYLDLVVTDDCYLLAFNGASEVAVIKVDFFGNKNELLAMTLKGSNHSVKAVDVDADGIYFISGIGGNKKTEVMVNMFSLEGEYKGSSVISQSSFNQKNSFAVMNADIKVNNNTLYAWIVYEGVNRDYIGFISMTQEGEIVGTNRVDDIPRSLYPLFVEDRAGDLHVRVVYENEDTSSGYYSLAFIKMNKEVDLEMVARVKDDAAWDLIKIEYVEDDDYVVLVRGGNAAYKYRPDRDFVDWYSMQGTIIDIIRYDGITYLIKNDYNGHLIVEELKIIEFE